MTEELWEEVEGDVAVAVHHYQMATALLEKDGLNDPGLSGYLANMALMHAMQSAHISLESALLKILSIIQEERPDGDTWDTDLIKRASRSLPSRPHILPADLYDAACISLECKKTAQYEYDSFSGDEWTTEMQAARKLAGELAVAVFAFKSAIIGQDCSS